MGEVVPIKPLPEIDLTSGLTDEFKEFASILLTPPKHEEKND